MRISTAIRLLPALGLSLLCAATNPALAQSTITQVDEIVALVEDDVILRSELDTAIKGIVERIRAQGGGIPPQDVLEKQVLERLVARMLQVQRAQRTGIRVSDQDVDQALTNMAQQNGISVTQLRQVIESEGEDFVEFRRSMSEEIMTERLRQRVVSGMTPVSETEIDILLASEDFAGGEYDISHILIALQDGATPQQIKEASDKAESIHKQLDEGMDFATAAINYSQSPEVLEGGHVGWRDLNSVPREFADAFRNLRAGQYTVPIRSQAGFHIIKVNDFREQRQVVVDEYRANHILVETNELVTPRAAMDETRALHDRLLEGEDFATLAREYSDDPSSANIGGDMGWFSPESFGERFQAMLDGLQDGEISEPFQSQAGWHIVQRTGFRKTDVTDEAMRNMARQTILQRRAESEVESFLRQLREEAYVDVRLPG
jgi:peptidyl-prolyl cis-trans isomerase SurA